MLLTAIEVFQIRPPVAYSSGSIGSQFPRWFGHNDISLLLFLSNYHNLQLSLPLLLVF